MPIFFSLHNVLIISACFNLLHVVISKSVGFLLMLSAHMLDISWPPYSIMANVLINAGFYSLTLATLMMVSLSSIQLVFTDDKFSFTSMDIRHRPLRNLLRYFLFGLLFVAVKFIAIIMLCLPFASLQIMAEHQLVAAYVLKDTFNAMVSNSTISFMVDFLITGFVLHVLLQRKYWGKRLCLIQIVA